MRSLGRFEVFPPLREFFQDSAFSLPYEAMKMMPGYDYSPPEEAHASGNEGRESMT